MSMIKTSAEDLEDIVMPVHKKRDKIRAAAMEGVKDLFPIIGTHREIHVSNIKIKPKDFSFNQHKKAVMLSGSLNEPLTGTVTIKDKKTGKVIDKKDNHTLMQVPHVTNNQTFVVGGNEYSVMHQFRTRPGVFTRKRRNDDIEASFNLSKGQNFRMSMEPKTGNMYMEYGTTKIPAYSALRGMGVQHSDIQKAIGKDLADRNKNSFDKNKDKHIAKLYSKLVPPSKRVHKSTQDQQREILNAFQNTAMDPDVNKRTLGSAEDKVTPTALLNASKKIVEVYNGNAPEDDRDSLEFQKLVSPEDMIKERIKVKSNELKYKFKNKADVLTRKKVDEILPSGSLSKTVKSFITTSQLAQLPTQYNPVEMLDSAASVTRLGEGGIASTRAIPEQLRQVHPSSFGIVDPVKTPDSNQIGVSVRMAAGVKKDSKGNVYAPVRNLTNGRINYISAQGIMNNAIAFPTQDTKSGRVDVIKAGKVYKAKPKDVKYQMLNANAMYSASTNLVPMIDGAQGNRLMMGSKYATQALALKDKETPLVQSLDENSAFNLSTEATIGHATLPNASVSGTVSKVDKDFIYIKDSLGKTHKEAYATNFPLASKTMLNHEVLVKKGDKVREGEVLADSNYTKGGTLALGKNLRVGYVAYHGLNSNDAVVISKSAAKKMTSVQMVKKVIPLDADTTVSSKKHFANYPKEFNKSQYDNLDDGLIKPGTKIKRGDPIAAVLRKSEPTVENKMFGRIHKSLRRNYADDSLKWDKDAEGEVVDVVKGPKQITVTVKTETPIKLGDKLANRYGGKGVVAKILDDEEMLQDEKGRPLDLLQTSVGVVSRINPGQVVETALAKVAEKTGKPIIVPQFQKVNNVKFAKALMKKHGVKDKETLTDPITGKKIPNVMVGPQYQYKLFKSTDTNFSARGIDGGYDLDQRPARGGYSGAKGTGDFVINALLAHDARDILKENATLKSSKNSEYWRALQLGRPVPKPEQSFVFNKFKGMLSTSGIKFNQEGTSVSLSPQTDKDVKSMSNGAIKNSKMLLSKNLSPETGGLFDLGATGGLKGNKWSHIELPEPVISPVFKDATRRLLGKTEKELDEEFISKGGEHIKKQLNSINVDSKIRSLNGQLKGQRGSQRDNSIKQIKALKSLKKQGVRPGDAYVVKNVAVMPPTMRPIVPSKSGDLLVSDINHLYKDTLQAADAMKEAKSLGLPDSDIQGIRKHLSQSVGAIAGMEPPVTPKLAQSQVKGVVNTISGTKEGYFMGKLIKKRLNLTGRATVAPDPSLGMDEVGIPEEMAWDMYTPFVTRRMVQRGYSALDAKDKIAKRDPLAREELVRETNLRPVMVNRAPTWHKHGLVGAKPKLISGKTIQVNPFMEKGMGMDYDGDTVQVHLPVSQGAIEDTKKMFVSKNVFNEVTRDKALAMPAMEAIAGMHIATSSSAGNKRSRTFNTQGEAMAAYKRGELKLSDPVIIKK
jgi:DNA-directed RNA polymerase beta subunit